MNSKFFLRSFLLISVFSFLVASCAVAEEPALDSPAVEPIPTIVPAATPTPLSDGFVEYFTQSGDTLPVVGAHFGVYLVDVIGAEGLDPTLLIDAGTRLLIKDLLSETSPPVILFPDAVVVFSPEAVGFDVQTFADQQGGYLSTVAELMTRGTTPASEVIAQLALEHSINPRILLALMEAESGWVRAVPEDEESAIYPFGYIRADRAGVYHQVGWAIRQLSEGYYGWRAGTLNWLTFVDGETLHLAPSLNAGTVAVLNFFAHMHTRDEWDELVYGENGISQIYQDLFGDPWERADGLEPLFPLGIAQPELNLPFPVDQKWNLTSGPHSAWGRYGPRAALDFAPPTAEPGCGNSIHWTTAAAPGRVVRVGNGVVVLDLDMDGYEQTGWVLVYMHVAYADRVELDAFVDTDDIIGHPSCEGGSSSGIHVHIARKYNGEWVLAGGGIPFEMSGYTAAEGERFCDYPYYGFCRGTLTNGDHQVFADPFGNYLTAIYRPDSDPKYFYTPTPGS